MKFIRRAKKGFWIALILLTVSSIIFTFLSSTNVIDYDSYDFNELETGDILFCRGKSIKSSLVILFNRGTTKYSHCGVIYKKKTIYYIIHATPTPVDHKNGRVVKERLEDFFSSNNVTIFSVYRMDSDHRNYIGKSFPFLMSYLKRKIIFDDDFDLKNRKLYCTELIWRIYKDAGLQLICHSDYNEIIYPSDLLKSKYLNPIFTSR